MYVLNDVCQVRPLLVVTENEEKLAHKEHELRQVTDRYDKLRQDHDDLTRQHALVTDEKATLSEQLRAEAEMSAEAEEVRYLLPKIVFDQLLIISTKYITLALVSLIVEWLLLLLWIHKKALLQ